MLNPEVLDDPIRVTGAIDETGQFNLHSLTWQGQRYTIIVQGRQWDTTHGRHLLVEASDGTRFEAQLRRKDFTWRVRQVWRKAMMV